MRNSESFAIGLSGVCWPKLLKSATWPCRTSRIVMPAVSPSATDCFRRASSAARPAAVKPSLVGSGTAACGHAGSAAPAAAPRAAFCFAAAGAGVCAWTVIARANRAASGTRTAVFTAFSPKACYRARFRRKNRAVRRSIAKARHLVKCVGFVTWLVCVALLAPLGARQSHRDPGCSQWRDCREMALAAADRGDFDALHDLAWRAVQL